jgi:hypothetical protein
MNIREFRDKVWKKYGAGCVDRCSKIYHEIENRLDDIPNMTHDELLQIIIKPSCRNSIEQKTAANYSYPAIRTLDILGANIGRFVNELNLKENFTKKYSSLYGRVSISRIYDSYVIPLINEFDISSLRNNEVDSTSLANWFRKNFRCRDDVVKIFTQVLVSLNIDVNIAESIVSHVKNSNGNDDVFLKLKEKYRNIHTNRKLINTYVDELHRVIGDTDVRNLSYNLCIKYCTDASNGRTLVETKIFILDILGCIHTGKLLSDKIIRESTEKYIDELIRTMNEDKNTKQRHKIVHEINREFGGLEMTETLSVNEILERYNRISKHKMIAYNIIKHILRNNTMLLENIELSINPKYKSVGIIQVFRMLPWRSNLLDDIMKKHSDRIETTTAYYDTRYKKLEYDTVVILNFIDEHVNRTYKRNVNIDDCIRWFLNTSTVEMIEKCLIDFGKNAGHDNTRVKNNVHVHHAKRHLINMMSMFNLIDNLPCKSELGSISIKDILIRIPDKRIDADPNIRRTFTDDEVNRMLKSVEFDPIYTLMLTIFKEVALRAGAICNLRYSDIIDNYNTPRHICNVLEKGNKNREFVTSPNLKRKIVTYIAHVKKIHGDQISGENIYVFGKDPHKPFPHTTLLAKLRSIAADADVNGLNVHPHAFRHTIVGKLMSEGNSADVVSKFMGHASTDTTIKYYWVQTIEELTNNLKNPFVDYKPSKDELEEETNEEINKLQTKLNTALKIIDVYNVNIIEAISKNSGVLELNQKIHKEIPDLVKLTNILQSLHDSSNYSTFTFD